jgi:hypothetical protein
MATIDDIFPKGKDYSWITGNGNISRIYGASNKRLLAKQIFHAFMKKALEEVVEDNVVLELPLYKGSILIEEVPEEVVKKKRSEGKFYDFSEIFAMGKVYDASYRFKKIDMFTRRRVIMGSELYRRMVELVNSGRRYYGIANQW